jgi:AAA+ superfamily predicted ATPase
MRVIVNEEWFDEIKGLMTADEVDVLGTKYNLSTGKGKMKISIADWSDASIKRFHEYLGKKADSGDRSAKLSQNVVQQWMEIKDNPDGSVVSRLEHVEPAMRKFVEASQNHYLFEQTQDGQFVPWFVNEIKYFTATEMGPAVVTIELVGINTGENKRKLRGSRGSSNTEGKTIQIEVEDIRQKKMSEILAGKGFYLETPARMESYQKEVKRYLAHCDVDGFQMSVVGKAKLIAGWYNNSFRPVGQAGRPAKMVMDPPDRERDADAIHSPYWDKNEEKVWKLPIHPVYEMFDLDEHADYRVHVNNAEPYVYDDTVDQKLILPTDVKDFLAVLIEHSKTKFADIVGGKEGGTIVLIEGSPGIGKTLTAEVYSEKMHRPLYKVQSSQLGITAEKVEEQLKEVLKRAERWGAILLLDEADVYIRERGDDIRQNAIVGVFLRVLEYYKGVLFMTTNRGTLTDDAIISRTTARFTYEMPSESDQVRMWKVMSEQNVVGLTGAEIVRIVKMMPNLSGRDIKNLLKLSMVMAVNQKGRVTPEIVKFVAKFKQSGNKGLVSISPCNRAS